MHILTPALPLILPFASRWVARQETLITARGIPLSPAELADARLVGVRSSKRIRLLFVPDVPMPGPLLLSVLGKWTGLISPQTAGMTLRYGIYIRQDCRGDRSLYLHEFVHVAQYERLGSIDAFLRPYLRECLNLGYPFGPLEQEAILTSAEILANEPSS